LGVGQASPVPRRPLRITAETPYGECSERLTAFGGLLTLVKFLDLLGCERAFAAHDVHPRREPKLGGYRMVLGIVMLLFIGFQRLGHCAYVRYDAMVCGMLRVAALPTVSTVYGAIEGARQGHNPKHRGKKGLRPVRRLNGFGARMTSPPTPATDIDATKSASCLPGRVSV